MVGGAVCSDVGGDVVGVLLLFGADEGPVVALTDAAGLAVLLLPDVASSAMLTPAATSSTAKIASGTASPPRRREGGGGGGPGRQGGPAMG